MWENDRGSGRFRRRGLLSAFKERSSWIGAGWLLAVWFFPILPHRAFARIEPATLHRNLEPVLLYGNSLPEFAGIHIDSIHAFTYNSETGTWRAIPFQIDEVKSGNYFAADDGLLDSDDELVLFSADLGARVPDGVWLADSLSRSFARIEIEVSDTLSEGNTAWAYLYLYAPDSVTANIPSYLSYDAHADRLLGRYYTVGYNNNGLLVIGAITQEGGGRNIDIVDRQKQRVKGNYKYGLITYNYNVSENNIEKERIDWAAGPVRVLRNLNARIVYYVGGLKVLDEDISFLTSFYPRSVYVGGGGAIDPDLGVYHIRQSLDLNSNATGMLFMNPYNPKPGIDSVVIDARRDDVNPQLVVPGKNWMMTTGDQGTIVTLLDIPKVGDVQKLYYRDYPSGTSDGTDDTGDGRSYGDVGVYIFTTGGRIITGQASSASWMYFLPANRQGTLGDSLLAFWEDPMRIIVRPQRVDSVGPARVSDLLASAVAEGAVQLTWTAPGDDGNTGQAERYDIRYSLKSPPVDDALEAIAAVMRNGDLDDWFRKATPVADTIPPKPAGTNESRIVEDLTIGKRYYFALRTYDDAGFVSPISNVASVMVVPVELSAFVAQVRGDSVVLAWTTTSETQNVGFAVERSTEDSQFEEIAFVPGFSTTSETHQYSFTDHPPGPGRYFYRLRQTNADGSFNTSQQTSVTLRPEDFRLLVAYPSPFNAQTRLRFRLLQANKTLIQIYDARGRQVRRIELTGTEPGLHELTWDGRDQSGRTLPSGVYLVRLIAKTQTSTTKVLLVR